MEVHPPHHPLHSWKDFWIHLATITVGLLIAISLEQSVEWAHRVHERHLLERDLREEGVHNMDVVNTDFRLLANEREWLLALRQDVDTMRASGGKIKLPYRKAPMQEEEALPSDAVWSTAKESAEVALLPRSKAEVYSRLYRQHDILSRTVVVWLDAESAVANLENGFKGPAGKGDPDLSRMSQAQLDAYSQLLTHDLTTIDEVVARLKNFSVADQAMLEGASTEEEMLKRMIELTKNQGHH